MKTSNCCGANVYDDSDICSRCKEHCEAQCECQYNEYHDGMTCECSEKCNFCYPDKVQ